jgi:hypothetical protein
MAFLFRIENEDGAAADPASFETAVPNWRAGDSIPLRGRTLLVIAKHGNLKAVQKLLGHSSISTTADNYVDWDIDQLAETLRGLLEEADS